MTVADEIFSLFETKGEDSYFGEPVSQLEHALQAAHFAQQEGATPELVAAALLHDIGHIAEDMPEDIADHGIDAHHEDLGQAWLAKRFGPEVYEPVRLHVAAKRYLCATEPEYFAKLSPASVQSLQLQGGPMSREEISRFETSPFFKDAVRLRHWDDLAKIPGLETAGMQSYRHLIESCGIHDLRR